MSKDVAQIRERYAAVTAPRHTCVRVRVTIEELRAGRPRELGACRYDLVDEQGVVRLSASCNAPDPEAEPDWIEDVGVLLAEIDRLGAIITSADRIAFRVDGVVVESVHGAWYVRPYDGKPDRRCGSIDEARAMATTIAKSLQWWKKVPAEAEWPNDGTCWHCSSAPADPDSGICSTCIDEIPEGG